MQTRVQKWGNSVALRIPKAFASELNIAPDTLVELSVVDGRLVIAPTRTVVKLSDLLEQVTDDNRHGEQDFGVPAGREAW